MLGGRETASALDCGAPLNQLPAKACFLGDQPEHEVRESRRTGPKVLETGPPSLRTNIEHLPNQSSDPLLGSTGIGAASRVFL
jgi:hypothetical protein